MDYEIRTLTPSEFPPLLKEIPDPPKRLYLRGTLPQQDATMLAVVGSRSYTNYGKTAAETLIAGLRGYNICIVSGLAIGIDGIAHRAALGASLNTIAIPGSGLNDDVLYPKRHHALAEEILASGGALLSEFEPDFRATEWSFPRRNRIMAGIAHAVLVIEAGERSGTLITSRLATDYNRDVLAVPGSIFSLGSRGPHMLIRLGATPITCAADILEAFGLEEGQIEKVTPSQLSKDESRLLSHLSSPTDKDSLIRSLGINAKDANILLMHMEMKGLIAEINGVFHRT